MNQPVLPPVLWVESPFPWIMLDHFWEKGHGDFPTGFFETSSGGDLSVRRNFVLRRTIWGIPWSRRDSSVLPMKHQDPDEDGWYLPCMVILGVVHCCFFPLTSIIFTGIIEITYNLFIFMAVHNSLLIKNLLVQSPNEPITIYPFSFWHLRSFPSLLVQNWCASRGRGGCGALKPGVSIVMGVPLYRWMVFVREIHNLKWMKMDDD